MQQPMAMPLDERRRQLQPHPVERRPAHSVFEPGDRGLRGDWRAAHRIPPEQQLVDGVVGQMVGVVAVGMAARDPEDPLAEQIRQACVESSAVRAGQPGSGRRPSQRPYARLAALSRTAPPSELACFCLRAAARSLSNRSRKRTV